MKQAVYKFPLSFDDNALCEVKLSPVNRILDVQFQRSAMCLWAIIDPDSTAFVTVKIRMVMTGEEVETLDGWAHVATLQYNALVAHIFYK